MIIAMTMASQVATAHDNPALPFSISNQNPFIQIYGLPATHIARLLPADQTAVRATLDIANNSAVAKKAGNEELTLDGESYRLSLSLHKGLANGIEVGMELPLVGHHNGVMDNFIEGWHDTLGLTNGERNKSPSNTLNYDYRRNGNVVMAIDELTNGVGDLRLYAARQIESNADQAVSAHASLKLPTGNANQLHGSGAPDLALSIAQSRDRWLSRWQLSTFVNGGLLLLGESDRFDAIQRKTVLFGSTGIIWDSRGIIDLKAQLDGHTRFYHSELRQLGSDTIQLTIGGSIHFGPAAQLDLGIGENLFTDTTPDFLINIAYRAVY